MPFAMSCRCMRAGLTAASASSMNSSRSRVTPVRRAMYSLTRSTFCAASRPNVEMSTSLVPCSVPVRTALESPLLAVLMYRAPSSTILVRQASSFVTISWPSPNCLVTAFQPPAASIVPM